MKRIFIGFFFFLACAPLHAQVGFPVNGLTDERMVWHAFTGARLWVDYKTQIDSATLLIRDGKVEAYGKNLALPEGTVLHPSDGLYIYPSFIDPFVKYGLPETSQSEPSKIPQIASANKGAFAWNQAIKSEANASQLFSVQSEAASGYRKAGFGTACTFLMDGIARGTGAVVTFADGNAQQAMLREKAAAAFSFKKGSSRQDYPTSEMGAIALIRQTFLDAEWYKNGGYREAANLSLEAWNESRNLPWIFEAENKWQSLRADKIGDEFGVRFIMRGSGDEYQQINEVKATGNPYILPLKFPDAIDVGDPYDAINVSLEELRHWEAAPANPYLLWKSGIQIAFTSSGLKDPAEFTEQLRKAVEYGLPRAEALKACTTTPAELLGISDITGSLQKGRIANFLVVSGDLFDKDAVIYENWIQGKPYILHRPPPAGIVGSYTMKMGPAQALGLRIWIERGNLKSLIIQGVDSSRASISFENNNISIGFDLKSPTGKISYVLNGYMAGATSKSFRGSGTGIAAFDWEANYAGPFTAPPIPADTTIHEQPSWAGIWYPNKAFGWDSIPGQETVLIRNITVWTNEKEGILQNTDVLISGGKIVSVGKNIDSGKAVVIDGTGKHLTAGIIDEHSHIAISGDVNECSHSVTAEVRIGDVINSDDINIYRQLGGGVTSAQLLHGSCNSIGGQSAMIKLRWGRAPEQMKFEDAPGFIKFALGENVKQSNWGDESKLRYPQTRMGIEQVYVDAFTRAKEYDAEWKNFGDGKKGHVKPRRDLRLETLVEILNGKRNITCHSYEQGEINMLMHVADSLGFRVNTFTHILEGYKVADKLKRHGAGASSFSDWWAYKYEVMEAIPYNGALLYRAGVTVAFNSDDAEMARRLNQEAAKAVKYGGVPEEEALKFVTLNPAKLLHIDNRVGSIKAGKDADVVIWNDNPLSVYAKAEITFVDGIRYFDRQRDIQLQERIRDERARLIRKMTDAKAKGKAGDLKKPSFRMEELKHCMDGADQQ